MKSISPSLQRISRFILSFCLAISFPAALAPAKHPVNPGPEDPPIRFHLPVPRPLPVEEALKTFRLPPGFHIECVASEPLIEDPIACSFGADGRIWVVEMRGYMHDLEGGGEKERVGRIKILESTKGDGHYDKATIFLDGLVMPRAVLATRGGALVGEPPELAFWKEQDGKAGQKTIVSTNFGVKGGQPESMANGLLPGIDNWIYNAAHTYRYRFQGGKWVADYSRSRGQWGVAQDDYGRLYYCTNGDLARGDPFPSRYFNRNPFYSALAAQNIELFKAQEVWPGHPTPGTNRGYSMSGSEKLRDDGSLAHPTAACGDGVYRGNLFPPEFRNNLFTCEPAGNLVKRMIVTDEGGRLAAKDGYDAAKKIDFLTSTDERFRPVNVYTGPDGALYVVDLYRGVLEHAAFLTNYLIKNINERHLLMPIHMGRIYRIVPDGVEAKRTILPTDARGLVESLADPNGWVRDMAQRLIVEKNDSKTVPLLEKMATERADAVARLHALYTLEGMNRLEGEITLKALADADVHVRIAAIRLIEPLLIPATRPLILPPLLKLMADPDPNVQLQLALTLSAVPDAAAEDAIAKLLTRSTAPTDMVRDCVISGLRGRELEFAERLLTMPTWSAESSDFAKVFSALSRCMIAEHHSGPMNRLLQLAAAQPDGSWRQIALLQGILPAVPPKKPATTQPATRYTTALAPKAPRKRIYLDAAPESLAMLLRSENADVKKLSSQLDARLAWPGKPGVPERPKIIPLTAAQQARFDHGKMVFGQVCAACHQQNGLGQEGLAPPLVDSEWVLGSETRIARIVLQGVNGPISVSGVPYRLEMPALATLGDEDIAAILTYIRREWEHDADPVSVEAIAKIRAETKGRAELWTAKELLEVK
jgi:mono/diheme cytochrome c family protein/glucose/arabinose dehydrogenase